MNGFNQLGQQLQAYPVNTPCNKVESTIIADLDYALKLASDVESGLQGMKYNLTGESDGGPACTDTPDPNTAYCKLGRLIESLNRSLDLKNRIVSKLG